MPTAEDIVKRLVAEILRNLDLLDEFGRLTGNGPCPRNEELFHDARLFLDGEHDCLLPAHWA